MVDRPGADNIPILRRLGGPLGIFQYPHTPVTPLVARKPVTGLAFEGIFERYYHRRINNDEKGLSRPLEDAGSVDLPGLFN